MDRPRDRTAGTSWLGRAQTRVEDFALLTGAGRFIDDLAVPGCLHLQFLRSPHPRGRIAALDVAAARAMTGVACVLTGADAGGLGPLAVNPLMADLRLPPTRFLPRDDVDAVGQPLAAVVAADDNTALDAVQAIGLTIEDMEPWGENVEEVFRERWLSGDVDAAFAQAAHVERIRIAHARLAPAPLEPRRAMASCDDAGMLTAWVATQAPHRARTDLAAMLGLAEDQVRVIAPDVGGAFGGKASIYPEDVIVALAALRLRRAVKWCGSRSEEFLAATQGRGATAEAELAVAADGRFLALRAQFEFPLGAWLPFSAVVPARNAGRILPGPYRIDHVDITVRGRRQNTAAVGIYRGAGRPEAAMVMERLAEQAARTCGLDPALVREINLLAPRHLPRKTPTGQVIDSGDFPGLLTLARERAGYEGLRRERDARRRNGQVCGVGLAVYVEPCGQGWESATVRLDPDGLVVAATGSSAQGQGRETTFAQIVADALGRDIAAVRVTHGDTQTCPPGIGALASRSTAIGGSALLQAAEAFREAARRCAAYRMGVSADQVVLTSNGFDSLGSSRRLSWADLAATVQDSRTLPPGLKPGLTTPVVYHADAEAWSSGCCIASVSIDPETGELTIDKIAWVDDAGVVVNPLLARGQLIGGLAQGLGEAMMERLVYDSEGQLVTASLMDYALPRARDIPPVDLGSMETPSPSNLLGAKGVGEAGCIGVPAAIVNAALDALSPFGVTHLDMPLTSEKIWQSMRRGAN